MQPHAVSQQVRFVASGTSAVVLRMNLITIIEKYVVILPGRVYGFG